MNLKTIALYAFFLLGTPYFVCGQEICTNGVDDDGDGLVDLNDDDCDCQAFQSTDAVTSLIPNPSFEQINCCPSAYASSMYNALSCANGWIQATSATSDFNHTCGFTLPGFSKPYPDGNGMVSCIVAPNYKEYVGSCLNSPLKAGTEYTLQFYMHTTIHDSYGKTCPFINLTPLNMTIYGSTSCSTMPVTTTGCPVGNYDWQPIGTAVYTPTNSWTSVSINFTTSVDIRAVMLGPPCSVPSSYPSTSSTSCFAYFAFDNLTLAKTTDFSVVSTKINGIHCNKDLIIKASTNEVGGTWQWYKDGIAIVGQTDSVLDISSNQLSQDGSGNFSVVYSKGSYCEKADINIPKPDYPNIAFAANKVCAGQQITLTDLSTVQNGTIENWQWDFNSDGIVDDTLNPAYYKIPISDTNISVTLTVVTNTGCADTFAQSFSVNPSPVTNFSWQSPCIGNPTVFNNSSSITGDSITNLQWDFNSGNGISTDANPSFQFPNTGSYQITLIASSTQNCSDTSVQTVTIYNLPTANFGVNATCVDQQTMFTDSSNGPNGAMVEWEWYLDSASTITSVTNPAVYTYTDTGTHSATLIARDQHGCGDTITKSFNINPSPVASFPDTSICQNIALVIPNWSAGFTPIVGYDWNFGDNTSSEVKEPTKTFNSEGFFSTNLKVTTTNGCIDDTTVTITVYPEPVTLISATNLCLGDSTLIASQSTVSTAFTENEIVSLDWLLDGDDAPSTKEQFIIKFESLGTYELELEVITNNGCSNKTKTSLDISPYPELAIEGHNLGCGPLCTPIINNSSVVSGQISDWVWTFPDGSTSSEAEPTYCFQNSTDSTVFYDLYVSATSDKGCQTLDTVNDFALVFPGPDLKVALDNSEKYCIRDSVKMSATTHVSCYVYWHIGTDSTLGYATTYAPQLYKNYDFMVTAITSNGCKDTSNINFTVELCEDEFFAPNVFTPNDDGVNDNFVIFNLPAGKHQLDIYNRWGQRIFKSEGSRYLIGWNGVNTSGQKAVPGTYYYVLQLEGGDIHKGALTLKR